MPTINDLVNEALVGWVEATGVDFTQTSWKIDFRSDGFGEYDLRKYTEALNESRDLDPTGLTTFMLLRGLTEGYLRSIAFTAHELILDPLGAENVLVPLRRLRTTLENPVVVDLIQDFQDKLRMAACRYGMPAEAMQSLEELLADKFHLATLRRDALRSIETLELHQFVQGAPDKVPPKVTMDIYEFWNVNSLLRALRAQSIPGISLCLVRDPEQIFASFFVLAVRNGATLSLLTDRAKTPHPEFWKMARRPDRDFRSRAELHWFPYNLLDIKSTKDQERLYASVRTAIVPYNTEAVVLGQVGDMPAPTFVWLALLFELIRDKFFEKNFKAPELSYTGEMVKVPHALVGSDGALVRDGLYTPLVVPPLTAADVTTESTAQQWEHPCSGINHWMVERYVEQVPVELLNPVGVKDQRLLESKSLESSFLPVDQAAIERRSWDKHAGELEIATFSPLNFGSKEALERDRLWTARVNQMRAIKRLADVEYGQELERVLAWCQRAIEHNANFLLDAAARGELLLPELRRTFAAPEILAPQNALRQVVGGNSFGSYYSKLRLGECLHVPGGGYRWVCYERGEVQATIFTSILPTCTDALAIVFGVPVRKLPVFLQHYYRHETHCCQNPILNREDPEDWVLVNPWNALNLTVNLASCKSALNARRKALGLPRKEWIEDKKDR